MQRRILIILCLFLGGNLLSTAQKKMSIKYEAPQGAKLYVSKIKPIITGDSLWYNAQIKYLGEGSGITSMPFAEWKSLMFSGYLITEKNGYLVNVEQIGKIKKKKKIYTLKGNLGEELSCRKESSLYFNISDVSVEVPEGVGGIKDRFSHNYWDSKVEEESGEYFVEKVIDGFLSWSLKRKKFLPIKNQFSLNDYGKTGTLKIEVEISGYYFVKYDVKVMAFDVFGKEIASEKASFEKVGYGDFLNDVQSVFVGVLGMEDVENSKINLQNEFADLKREWVKLSVKNTQHCTNMDEIAKSVVTVKTEGGHGSGVIIGVDGYIITNHHVISDKDTIEIYTEDGDTISAELVRSNPFFDLALLKCDTIFEKSIKLSNIKGHAAFGEKVYSVGTPLDLGLAGSISRGIVTGIRTFGEVDYYQTSSSVNPGNSGGALVDANFDLIGIVNAKLVGVGVSKLGFAIPSYQIFEFLNITTN